MDKIFVDKMKFLCRDKIFVEKHVGIFFEKVKKLIMGRHAGKLGQRKNFFASLVDDMMR